MQILKEYYRLIGPFGAIILTYFFLHFFSNWPGIYGSDALFYSSQFTQGQTVSWQSFLYTQFLQFTFSSESFLGRALVIQALTVLSFVSIIFMTLRNISTLLAMLTVIFFIFFPDNILFQLYHERDVFFSWFVFFPSFFILIKALKGESLVKVEFYLMLLLLFLAVLLRKEATVAFFLFFLQVWGLKIVKGFSIKKYLVISVIIFGVLISCTSFFKNHFSPKNKYSMNATLGTYFYFTVLENKELSPDEQQIVDSTIDVDSGYDFKEDGVVFRVLKPNLMANDILAFNKMVTAWVFQDPVVFLESRLYLWSLPMANLYKNKSPSRFHEEGYEETLKISQKVQEIHSQNTLFGMSQYFFADSHFMKNFFPFRDWAQFLLILFIVLFLGTAFDLRFLYSGLGVMSHFLIVFLVAPELKAKYFYLNFLWLFFVLPLVIYWVTQKKIAQQPRPGTKL